MWFFTKAAKGFPGISKRGYAFVMDFIILVPVRFLVLYIFHKLWFEKKFVNFGDSFYKIFGQDKGFDINNELHRKLALEMGMLDAIVSFGLILFLCGLIYNTLMIVSTWQATFGKRFFNIIVARKSVTGTIEKQVEYKRLGVWSAMFRYLATLLFWIVPLFLVNFFLNKEYAPLAVFGTIWAFWYEIGFLNKQGRSIHDLISNTILIDGRINKKFSLKK